MTYSKIGPFVDGGPPYLSAADLNRLEQGVIDANTALAPPPSGGDDSAVLQALLNQASSGAGIGTLILQAGTYKANLTTSHLYQQPLIIGQGRYQTKIQSLDTQRAVITFDGISGSLSGGGIRSCGLYAVAAGQGIGIEYRGACGVASSDIHLDSFQEGVRFHNLGAGNFTEFDTFEGDILSCTIPVHYVVDGGDPSFHGSGLVGNTVINGGWSGPGVLIDSTAFPYNAPMSATFFTSTSGAALISNRNGSRTANFYGTLRKEGPPCFFGESGQFTVAYSGGILSMGGGAGDHLGSLYLAEKFYYNPDDGNTTFQLRPFQKRVPQTAGTMQATTETIGTSIINVDVVATNYHYSYLLHCWQSPYDNSGVVTVLANPRSQNGTGWGAPVFAWANRGLTITNTATGFNVTSYLSIAPQTAFIVDDRFGQ